MTAKNKRRGNDFEREVVKLAEAFDLDARRAWGSDGRALGEDPDVDVVIDMCPGTLRATRIKIQCKRRRKLAGYLLPSSDVDVVAMRQDGDRQAYALIRLGWLLRLLSHEESGE